MTKTPWWFWVAAGLSLLWNAGGAYDYLMSMTRNEAYLASYPAEAVAWLDAMPAWRVALWAFAIWSSVAAAVLLLLRRGLAMTAFMFSLVFIVFGIAADVLALGRADLYAGGQAFFTGLIVVLTIAQFWFAKWTRRKGILR